MFNLLISKNAEGQNGENIEFESMDAAQDAVVLMQFPLSQLGYEFQDDNFIDRDQCFFTFKRGKERLYIQIQEIV